MGQHSNHYLPGWYVANGKGITRTSHDDRHIIFSIATFRFCNQPHKISPSPCETFRVSGLTKRYRENDFGSFRKNVKHVPQQCQVIFAQPKTSVLNLKNLIGLLPSTVQAIVPARIQFRYLQQEEILALQNKGSDGDHVTLENLTREGLLWWMENLKVCNGRKIQQRKPHMIILLDASTKDKRHIAKEFSSKGTKLLCHISWR